MARYAGIRGRLGFPLAVLFGCSVAGCSGRVSEVDSAASGGPQRGILEVGWAITAAFAEATGPLPPSHESTLADIAAGATSCQVRRSTAYLVSAATPRTGTTVSAGTITITGGLLPITLTPERWVQDDGRSRVDYPVWPLNPGIALIRPGDLVTIAASGEAVPPFAVDITVPDTISVTLPDPRA
ncbi:MAG: hypothetical protein JOZ69_07770 [Myxococcales bacterium]|nr:hypothetical protein [Myxococcales bacterium]